MKKDQKELLKDGVRIESKTYTLHKYSTDDLAQLMDVRNHRIIHNKFNYVWEHKFNGEWIRRSIMDYQDSKKAYSHLRFWIPIWSKEYNKRVSAIEMIRMKQETAAWSEAINILNRDYLKKAEKVRRVYRLLSDLTKKEVAELTGMSYIQVKRILKND